MSRGVSGRTRSEGVAIGRSRNIRSTSAGVESGCGSIVERSARPAAVALLGGLIITGAGCAPGVQWRYGAFEPIFTDAKATGRLSLVYFRSWYSVQCTKAEDSVFNDPRLKTATADMHCVPLDFDWDKPLATAWKVTTVPSIVILSPNEEILESYSGEFTVAAVLEAIARAKSRYAVSTQPASAGAP